MVDIERLRSSLRELREERNHLTAELDQLRQRTSALGQAIAGIEALLASENASDFREELASGIASVANGDGGVILVGSGKAPSAIEAIRRVLMSTERRLTTKSLNDELRRRGWGSKSKNPENATSANAASAYAEIVEIQRERVGMGFEYWYAPVGEAPVKEEMVDSE